MLNCLAEQLPLEAFGVEQLFGDGYIWVTHRVHVEDLER